jgi:acetyl-CoA carboxylase biotin carboxyl carrier protein
MEYKQIQELIKLVNKSNIGELKIKEGDFEIMIRSQGYVEAVKSKLAGGPVTLAPMTGGILNQPIVDQGQVDTHSTGTTETPTDETSGLITIKSPMIGTFYRSPSPDKDPYIKVGDSINKGDVICIIEAMKLFNEIESEVEGKIVKVLIEDSSPVEYDQPLFLVDPNA